MSIGTIDSSARRAIQFTPMETRRSLLVDAAIQAEELGFESIIIPEGWGLDATVVLTEIALRTSRIQIVAGILSIWGRTPGTLAMTAATLDDLSEGRFVLGLGTSTGQLAEGFHGQAFAAPARALEDTVCGVRDLLAGERARTSSSRTKGLRLGQAPRPDIPIWVAGLGPRAVGVATTHGDAWFPAVVPRHAVSTLAAGADRPDCQVVTCTLAAPDRRAAEQIVGWYMTGMGSLYGDLCRREGFEAEVDALRAANPRPKPGAIEWPTCADVLLDQLAVFGDRDAVAASLRAWDQVSDVVAVTIGPGSAKELAQIIDAAAPAVQEQAFTPSRRG